MDAEREMMQKLPGKKRDRLIAGIYGLGLSLSWLLGRVLERNGALAKPCFPELVLFVFGWLLASSGAFFLWRWLDRKRGNHRVEDAVSGKREKRPVFLSWVLLMLTDLISLLAVYPGFFVYDASEELAMVQTRCFTTHHPLLHVLLLGGVILAMHKVIGSYNAGIFVYLLLQMAVMNAAFVFLLQDMKRRHAGRGIRIFGLLWYALCPVVTMFVLCSCKDGLFAAALLLMTVFLRRILEESSGCGGDSGKAEQTGRADRTGFVLSAMFMMLLRNNGVYAYAVFLVLLVPAVLFSRFRGRKKRGQSAGDSGRNGDLWKRAILFVLPILLYAGGSKGLAGLVHATSEESQEILTVPIMQLARVWNAEPESFSLEEKEAMELLMDSPDAWELYNPVLSDQVKLHFDSAAYRQDRGAFWRLWFSKGLRHPASYLNAWLMTSYGFYAPGAVIDCYRGNTVYTFTYGDSSYFGYETEQPGIRESRLPVLDSWYRFLSLDERAQKLLLPGVLLSPGVMAWLFFLVLFDLWRRKEGKALLSLLPVFLVWLTVLLGPCTLPRYVVYLWIGLPCFLTELVTFESE